jgi:hypothetical protein
MLISVNYDVAILCVLRIYWQCITVLPIVCPLLLPVAGNHVVEFCRP